MLSAPGVHFAALTADTDFRLPMVRLVHGSFFTDVSWVLRGFSNRMYAIVSSASKIGFDVLDANQPTTVVAQRKGVWQTWKEDGILAFYKQQTIYVRANGWEARAAPAAPRRWPSPLYTEPLCPRPEHTIDYRPLPCVRTPPGHSRSLCAPDALSRPAHPQYTHVRAASAHLPTPLRARSHSHR